MTTTAYQPIHAESGWVRKWALEQGLFLYRKEKDELWSHSLLDGGLLSLQTAQHYATLHQHIVSDALQNQGKIGICEAFPPVIGMWPSRPAGYQPSRFPFYVFPPRHLIVRASRYLHKPLSGFVPDVFWNADNQKEDVDAIKLAGENHKQTHHTFGVPKTPGIPIPLVTTPRSMKPPEPQDETTKRSWRSCCFAMDLDYGTLGADRPYQWTKLRDEIQVIQTAMVQMGAAEKEVTCIVCEAHENNKLGIHLYFPDTCYYPEECLMVAEYAKVKLEERFLKPHCGDHVWPDVIDRGIYSSTLRMPLVQKVSKCPACDKPKRASRNAAAAMTMATTMTTTDGFARPAPMSRTPKCGTCLGKTRVYANRRYWPIGVLIFGETNLSEPMWSQMADYYQQKAQPWNSEGFWKSKHLAKSTAAAKDPDGDLAKLLLDDDDEEEDDVEDEEDNGHDDHILDKRDEKRTDTHSKHHPHRIALNDDMAGTRGLVLLDLCSVRLVKKRNKTCFKPPEMKASLPRSKHSPRAWDFFFESVLAAVSNWNLKDDQVPDRLVYASAQTILSRLQRQREQSVAIGNQTHTLPAHTERNVLPPPPPPNVLSQEPNAETVGTIALALSIVPHPLHGPMGDVTNLWKAIAEHDKSRAIKILSNAEPLKRVGRTLAAEAKKRDQLAHLALHGEQEPIEKLEDLTKGPYKGFKIATIVNHRSLVETDPLERCNRLTQYLRTNTIKEYKDVRAETITYSEHYGNWMVRLKGEGMTYCNIARRYHRTAETVLIIFRRGIGEIRQYCRHAQCKQSSFLLGPIRDKGVAALFAPTELMAKDLKTMTETDIELAKRTQAINHPLSLPPPANAVVNGKQRKAKDPLRVKMTEVSSLQPSSLHPSQSSSNLFGQLMEESLAASTVSSVTSTTSSASSASQDAHDSRSSLSLVWGSDDHHHHSADQARDEKESARLTRGDGTKTTSQGPVDFSNFLNVSTSKESSDMPTKKRKREAKPAPSIAKEPAPQIKYAKFF